MQRPRPSCAPADSTVSLPHAHRTYRDLNALVADYLYVEGFRDAAENFTREAGLAPAIDLASIESRMEIKQAVQRGDVEEATELVNDLDPEVSARSVCIPSPWIEDEGSVVSTRIILYYAPLSGLLWGCNDPGAAR